MYRDANYYWDSLNLTSKTCFSLIHPLNLSIAFSLPLVNLKHICWHFIFQANATATLLRLFVCPVAQNFWFVSRGTKELQSMHLMNFILSVCIFESFSKFRL